MDIIDTSELIVPIARLVLGLPVSAVPSDQIPEWLEKGMPAMLEIIKDFNDNL